jgi:hypothetical protein
MNTKSNFYGNTNGLIRQVISYKLNYFVRDATLKYLREEEDFREETT